MKKILFTVLMLFPMLACESKIKSDKNISSNIMLGKHIPAVFKFKNGKKDTSQIIIRFVSSKRKLVFGKLLINVNYYKADNLPMIDSLGFNYEPNEKVSREYPYISATNYSGSESSRPIFGNHHSRMSSSQLKYYQYCLGKTFKIKFPEMRKEVNLVFTAESPGHTFSLLFPLSNKEGLFSYSIDKIYSCPNSTIEYHFDIDTYRCENIKSRHP